MSILKGLTSIALVLLLAACGASVEAPETVTETAQLELQIVSSLPDSETIRNLEVVDEDGEVLYVASGFVNRFHTLTLEMGKTYTVLAQSNAWDDMGHRGSISLTKEVTLVSANQNVVLDLRLVYTPDFLVQSDIRSVVQLPILKNLNRDGSGSTGLTFVGGSYSSYITLPIDVVNTYFGDEGAVRWDERSATIIPNVFGESEFGLVLLEIQYPGVPSGNCFNIGRFDLSWGDEFSELNQKLEVLIPCRG